MHLLRQKKNQSEKWGFNNIHDSLLIVHYMFDSWITNEILIQDIYSLEEMEEFFIEKISKKRH